jgi:hypothetical protein
MKDLIIVILIAIILFLLWNGRRSSSFGSVGSGQTPPVPIEVTQAILNKVQESKPDEYPIETLFITAQDKGSYNARFMFFNTKHFFGQQYDVNAQISDGGSIEITELSATSKPDPTVGYKPDVYQPFKTVQDSADSQLKVLVASRPETLVQTDMTLGTRA